MFVIFFVIFKYNRLKKINNILVFLFGNFIYVFLLKIYIVLRGEIIIGFLVIK